MSPELVPLLNGLDQATARQRLGHCCGAKRWIDTVVAARPFKDAAALLLVIDGAFVRMTELDWREAFSHHPKIGDIDSLRKKFASTSHLASKEQAGVRAASEDTLERLADGNRDYEAKHGFIFIVCATGKSAAEMLALLEDRVHNDTETELKLAAAEQRKITMLRLEKLLETKGAR